jgi:NAD(P)-dependent dehydrogenase (short-subunit alcohol dehydrogenase family)
VGVLAGRLALVTGASRGIGAATAEALAGAGCRVVRVARSFPGAGQGAFQDVVSDLNDPAQVATLAERIAREHGPPDIIVNNAGSFLLRPLEHTTIDEFDAQVGINLRAPFALARAFLPMLRGVGRGCFISVGSVADHSGLPENAA